MPVDDDMQTEYDFRGKTGERGKYFQAYRQGHSVTVKKRDGRTETRYFSLEEGAVMLDPELRDYFPDSEAVNRALHGLIALLPDRQTSR